MAIRVQGGNSAALGARAELLVRRARLLVSTIRRDLRTSELAQIFLCACLGIALGVAVALLRDFTFFLHRINFGLRPHEYLSAALDVARSRTVAVPFLGGLFLGLVMRAMRRARGADIVDPIEANALYGGRMSFPDSMRLVFSTLVSNAAGASLGMEAGYTQLGSAVYSYIGQRFRLRRADQRVFVTAGAAAAIAAAFNAPLAGAFYGFELILGSYMPRALAPVAAAAVCAGLAERSVSHLQMLFTVSSGLALTPRDYALFALMGVLAAGIAILTMRLVTWTERSLRATQIPDWMRPAVGGLALSLVAFYFPQVLGSGHGGIQFHIDTQWPWFLLFALMCAKIVASAVSVGSGFRGGLFSSSLFLGALFGAVFAEVAALAFPDIAGERSAFILAGMGSMAAAIIGAPVTMVFLVLEATGDFRVTIGVLAAVVIASTIVRLTFGYSFSTWRFHLRGLGITGAHDVGWIADLTVGRLMRADAAVVVNNTTLRTLRGLYPPGSTKRIFVSDQKGQFVGGIDPAELHKREIDDMVDGLVAADLADGENLYLLPGDNIRTAMLRFEDTQSEVLPVLAAHADHRVVGYMSEAYALRRYTQELERQRSSETGDSDLFAPERTAPP